uniref:Choline O-acetyltransferase n=1 Tax=Syphacia muris TaxID=451379 RepID=A0A158R4A2_9BILA
MIEKPLRKAPVPAIKDTIQRYLEYAKVVAVNNSAAYERTKIAAENFINSQQCLQDKLEKIAQNQDNWINQFWLTEMYLKIRLPLPVNSSPAYIFPKQSFKDLEDQINYASWLVRGFCEFKDKIDRKEISRELSTGKNKVPMCMEQYDRILRSYREPDFDVDQQHYDESSKQREDEHIIAMCNKQAFMICTRINGNLLSQPEIEYQLQEAFRRSRNRPSESVIAVAAGSVGDRNVSAEFWSKMKKIKQNATSLNSIKSASFILCLDVLPDKYCVNTDDFESQLALSGKHLLTGFGSDVCGLNRWYDSPIQLIVASNGINGLCIEHSIAEGIVIINMSEFVLDYVQKYRRSIQTPSKAPKQHKIKPMPLSWSVGAEEFSLMDQNIREFDKLFNDLELCILNFKDFGKEFIKAKKFSPDAFVQLTMQLAYFNLHKKLVSTYESASIRRFQGGRVDNIRAATPEALKWVKAMQPDSGSDSSMRRQLYNEAMAKQVQVTFENISGYGIDNHLCALEVLAREQYKGSDKMPELFTDSLWPEIMRFPLSTSQVTTSAQFSGSYLCYGPVVRDGYGCSYNIQPSSIIFAISAFKTCPTTNEKLPKLPLPLLEHTFQRYLEYAEVICDEKALENTRNAVKHFKQYEIDLVEQLKQIAESSDNWAKKFWLPAFYLKDRNPLPINVSPCYVLPYHKHDNYDHFLSFATCIACGFLECKDHIARKKISCDYSRKGDQLCMEQYDKIFSSYREPRIDQDVLHYKTDANMSSASEQHIIVMCRNQAFVLQTHFDGCLMSPAEIMQQIREIDRLSEQNLNENLKMIGGGSCGYRNDAALFWQEMRKDDNNNKNFELAKQASFVLCLDIDNTLAGNERLSPSVINQGKQLLFGNGSKRFGLNRWYDSTLQIIVSTNGTNGICIEHSVAEGVAIFKIVDSALTYVQRNIGNFINIKDPSDSTINRRHQLNWHFANTTTTLLKKQIESFNEITNDIELCVLKFDEFGKELIKSLQLSPDGFIQLAIQLATYKWFGKLVPTYESGSLRLFSGGRVDNIRATTPETSRWVKAMTDDTAQLDLKKQLFYEAAKKQAIITRENVSGNGIDNHLIALFELANLNVKEGKRKCLPALFSDPTWNTLMQFPVSTSQATQSTLFPDRYNFYGPMQSDGYGIPYNVQKQFIILTVSARRSSTVTDVNKFAQLIRLSLLEIRDLILAKQ